MLELVKRQGDRIRIANVGDVVEVHVAEIARGQVRLQVTPSADMDAAVAALFGDNPPLFLRRQAD